MTDFLLDTLGLANPDVTELPEMDMRSALGVAANRVKEVFADYPKDEAQIRLVIGRAYDTLGRPDLALPHLRRARYLHQHVLHSDAPELMSVLVALFPVAERMGDLSWVSIGYELVSLGVAVIAREEPELAQAFVNQFTQANDISVSPKHVRKQWDTLRAQLAEPGRRTGLSPALLHSMLVAIPVQLGWQSFSIEAPEMIEELLAGMTQRLTHGAVRRTTEYALFFRIRAEDFAGAKALAESMLKRLNVVLSPDHWYLEIYRSVIGGCLVDERRYEEALPILERSLAVFNGSVAPDLGAAADVQLRLALLHEATGRADLAAPYRRALVDYALQQVQGIQWSMLRTFLDPRFAGTVAAFDAFDELLQSTRESDLPLSASTAEFADLASSLADACRRDAPDDDPAGMLLATQLATRASILTEAGLSGPASRRVMDEARQMASARPGQRPLVQIAIAVGWLEVLYGSGEAVAARRFAPTVDALVAEYLASTVKYDPLPLECNLVIRALATRPGLSATTYDTAARLAERSLLAVPDRHEFLTTVGAALFRARRDREALELLSEVDALSSAGSGDVTPAAAPSLAFLSMAHHRLGHASEAADALARLRAAVSAAGPFAGATDLALLAEAEVLLAD